MEEQREEGILRVEDAMREVQGSALEAQATVDAALAAAGSGESLLVRLSPGGWGSVTAQELRALVAEGKGASPLSSATTISPLPFLHPDHPLETALRYVDRWPVVPVVNRADFRKLEGVISQRDVLDRYREFGEG
jgi:CIC family chloride channel protein